jgi:transcriptional regulator with XRE-family HTH domain
MEPLGDRLKKERESRNLTLKEVAAATRIKEQLLRAIESDRYDLLPHAFYAKAHVGAYARYLRLDPNEIFCGLQEHFKPFSPAPVDRTARGLLSRKPVGRLDAGDNRRTYSPRWIGGGALFLIFAFVGLYGLSGQNVSLLEKQSILVQGKAEAQKAVQAIQKEITMIGEIEARDVMPAAAGLCDVLEADLGKGLDLKEGRSVLTERCVEFLSNNQKVYFLTRIQARKEGKILHLWYRDGKEFQRTEMEIKPPAWTVYSYLTLRPGHAGNWMAELRDGNTILASRTFNVAEAPDL